MKIDSSSNRLRQQARDWSYFLTDTGGGLFLTPVAVKRCGLATSWSIGRGSVGTPGAPAIRCLDSRAGRIREVDPVWDQEGDGMLGQRWFAGGIWTFDYPRKTLLLSPRRFIPRPNSRRTAFRSVSPHSAACTVAIIRE